MISNHLGQPLGEPVNWSGAARPARQSLGQGRFCRVDPLQAADHAAALFAAQALDTTGANWTYLSQPPPADEHEYRSRLEQQQLSTDPLFYTVLDNAQEPVGTASYLRIEPEAGSLEVGHIHFTPRMQRGPLSTEAMYLMMRHAFEDLGYRRYEWKCDRLNAPSRKAALRLGFTFEGIFRQHRVVKGHNRDTAWYSVVDKEWPILDQAFQKWLDPSNFDAQGNQLHRLEDYR
ncbi:MAG: GNAT family N-acetyltransferase [Candidatus Eremiobacteraeota bacterium]|nr:GNAT family N-acetyltransferase [Candidatus Eremiobacteraeota bacterium]MCW5868104.1 GNAT family N-acetyltransferase [Candidatus Eremiobacteraeota bacterium]